MIEKYPISVRNLTLAYGDKVIMRNISFNVCQEEIVTIIGASGSGKSTLLKYLIGLKCSDDGVVSVMGTDISKAVLRNNTAILNRIGVMYQSGALWSSKTILENVELPLEEFTKMSANERRDLARYKLSLVGLLSAENKYPSELSGGMIKRASIARAIALDPEILFFDEPSAGLDPITGQHLDDLILELRRTLKTTIVIVTHELESIFKISDRVVFLDRDLKEMGAIGKPSELVQTMPPKSAVVQFLTRGKL